MERQKEATAPKAANEADLFIYPSFESPKALKDYYLQMSGFMNFELPTRPNDAEGLKRLSRKLKQYLAILHQLNGHNWGEGIADMQAACGGFLMLKNENFRKKRAVNETVSKHFEFIIRISQNIYLLRQLQGLLDIHHRNVNLLIREQEKPVA